MRSSTNGVSPSATWVGRSPVFAAYRGPEHSRHHRRTVDANTKELGALAIAVSKQCYGYVASHARGARPGVGRLTTRSPKPSASQSSLSASPCQRTLPDLGATRCDTGAGALVRCGPVIQ